MRLVLRCLLNLSLNLFKAVSMFLKETSLDKSEYIDVLLYEHLRLKLIYFPLGLLLIN